MEESANKTPSRSKSAKRDSTSLRNSEHTSGSSSQSRTFEPNWEIHSGRRNYISGRDPAANNNKHHKSPFGVSSSGASCNSSNKVPVSERQQLHQILKQQQLHSAKKFDSENSLRVTSPRVDLTESCVTPKSSRKSFEKKNTRGETPLHVACIQGDYKQVKRLIENGCSVNTSDHAGWTPLHEACNRGWYKVARLLIASGAKVNATNKQINGFTPLHDAAVNSHVQIVKLLLRYGADPDALTNDQKRAIDLATDPLVVKAIRNATSSSSSLDNTNRNNNGESGFPESTPVEVDGAQINTSLSLTPSSSSLLSLPGTPHVPIAGNCRRSLFKVSGQEILETEGNFITGTNMTASDQGQQNNGCSGGSGRSGSGGSHQQSTSSGISTSTSGSSSASVGGNASGGDDTTGTSTATSPNNSRLSGSRSTKDDSQGFALGSGGSLSGASEGSTGPSGRTAESQVGDGGSSSSKGDDTNTHAPSLASAGPSSADDASGPAVSTSGRGSGQDGGCELQQQDVSNSSSNRVGSGQSGQITLGGSGCEQTDGNISAGNASASGDISDSGSTMSVSGTASAASVQGGAVSSSSGLQRGGGSEQGQRSDDAGEPMDISEQPSSKSSSHGASKKRRKSVDKDNNSPAASTGTASSLSEQNAGGRSERSDRAKAELMKTAARSPRPKKQKGRKDAESKSGSEKGDKDDGGSGKSEKDSSVSSGGGLKGDKGSGDARNSASADKAGIDSKSSIDKSSGAMSEKVGVGDKTGSGIGTASGSSSAELGGGVASISGGASSSGGSGGTSTGKGSERADGNNGSNANKSSTNNNGNSGGSGPSNAASAAASNMNSSSNANASSGSDHEGGDKDSTASGDGLKVPPLKIVLPPMSSASGGEKECNSSDASTTATNSAKGKQLPYIVNSPLAGNSPQPASPAANSPLETKEWREESKRVTRSSQRAQIHDSNNNDEDDAPAPSSGKTHPRKRKIRNTRGSAAASSSGQRESSRGAGSSQNSAASSSTGGENSRGTNSGDKNSASLNDEDALELLPPPEKDYFGEPSTMFNPYEALKNIRRAVDKRRKSQISAEIRPKAPTSFKDYLLNKCTYALENNPASRQGIVMAPPPNGLSAPLRDLFIEQETARYQLRLQQLMERDKLVLAAEQEILRVNAHEARAAAGQTIPLSVTTVLRDMEIYNTLDPESNLYNPRTGMTAVNPLLDNHVKDPSRYNNGRLFKSWLQDTDDKWEREKESLLLRHHSEAEALRAVQTMDWTWKAKECIPTTPDTQGDSKGDPKADDKNAISASEKDKQNLERDLALDLNLCVPMVHVSDDFDLLPS